MPEPAATQALDLASGAERRSAPRLAPRHISIACLAARRLPRMVVGRVTDVSAGGLGLLANAAIEPGELLRIELIGAAAVLAYVAHATPDSTGRWIVGCKLLKPLAADVLKQLTS